MTDRTDSTKPTRITAARREAWQRRRRLAQDAEFYWMAHQIPAQVMRAILLAVRDGTDAPLRALPPEYAARLVDAYRQILEQRKREQRVVPLRANTA